MFNRKFMLIAILVSLLAISAVSANEINGTDEITADGIAVDETIMPEGEFIQDNSGDILSISDDDFLNVNKGTFTELQNKIAGSTGSTISLEKDYSYDDGFDTAGINIAKSLTINGNGHTIDALGKSRIFLIEGNNVVLKDIKFCNAKSTSSGGAISWSGSDGSLSGCTFVDNSATGWSSGGAIYWSGSNGVLNDCTFTNNYADNWCGAIYWPDSGGILRGCTFINNAADNWCGAICGGNASECTFINNTAGYDGGAIYKGNAEKCTFINNSANWGGAISECSAVNSIFINNHAIFNGGAIRQGSAVGCTFTNNVAEDDGGAISGGSAENCTFINNTAQYHDGGAVHSGDASDCTFINNTANENGGAIYSGNAVNCKFTNNIAQYDNGGAIYGGNAFDCTFNNNEATNGGAIYNLGDLLVQNCVFNNNRALRDGGAIYAVCFKEFEAEYIWVNVNIHSAAQEPVWVKQISSPAHVDFYTCIVEDSTFTDNHAGGYQYVEDDLIWSRGEDGHGGAIYAEGYENATENNLNAVNSIFNGNKARIDGNRYCYDDVDGKVITTGCTFNSNGFTVSDGNYYYLTLDKIRYNGDLKLLEFNLKDSDENPVENARIYVTVNNETSIVTTTSNGRGILGLDLDSGIYEVICEYAGILTISIVNFNSTADYYLTANNVTKYYGGEQLLVVRLTDGNGKPIEGAEVGVAVDEVRYRDISFIFTTDSNGQDSSNFNSLKLNPGTYDVISIYEDWLTTDESEYFLTTSTITIKSTIDVKDVAAEYSKSSVGATFLDTNGKALTNKEVIFDVGGKKYSATTNGNGVATANVDLGIGNYNVTAVNPVNNERKQFKLVISKANSQIALASAQNNGVVTLTAALTPAGATGNVVFTVGGKTHTAAIKDGKAVLTLTDLNPNDYVASASYNGDSNLNPSSSNTVTFTVLDVYPILTANDVTKFYGGSEKLQITLVDSLGNKIGNANVNVNANGKTSTVKTDANGKASLDLDWGVGNYDVVLSYEGVSATSKVTVKSTITVADASGVYSNAKVSATFLDSTGKALASKQVTFKINNKDYAATTNNNGVATANIDWGAETYKVTAVNPINNEQKQFNLVITKANSQIALAAAQNNGVVTLTAALTPAGATGNVVFTVGGKTHTVAIKGGKAVLTLSDLDPKDYTASASYNGDGNLNPSSSNTVTFTVLDVYPILTANDVAKFYGGSEKLQITLVDSLGNKIGNANVNVNANGKTLTVKTDANGKASLDLDWGVGNYDVVSSYNDVSATSKVTVKSTISAADATGVYSNSKVTATFLDATGKALASKQVTFKINNKDYTATTNNNGVVTATVDLDAGNYKVTAVNPASKEQKQFKLLISKAGSKIALTSAQNNGAATLTATLAHASATGSVVFNVNGENKNAAISNGKATLTLKDLKAGNYVITASYNGDKNFNASKSSTVTFKIDEVYPILTANNLTKTYGNSNNFVVNLIDSKGNAIANANVNVNINGKITPIKTDSNGKATMPITLKPAEYAATVTYGNVQTTAKITVKKATPKITAKAKTFKKADKTKKYTVTLKNNKNKLLTGSTVKITVNKKTYTAKTKKGVATFKLTKLTKKGKYTATVKYLGSKLYNAKSVKVKITVK